MDVDSDRPARPGASSLVLLALLQVLVSFSIAQAESAAPDLQQLPEETATQLAGSPEVLAIYHASPPLRRLFQSLDGPAGMALVDALTDPRTRAGLLHSPGLLEKYPRLSTGDQKEALSRVRNLEGIRQDPRLESYIRAIMVGGVDEGEPEEMKRRANSVEKAWWNPVPRLEGELAVWLSSRVEDRTPGGVDSRHRSATRTAPPGIVSMDEDLPATE